MPMSARRPSTIFLTSGRPTEFYGLYSKDYRYRCFSSINSHTFIIFVLEEMVDSVDELKSSRSTQGKDFPNFEILDARIASALNKIIQNSHFKKKDTLEEQNAQQRIGFFKKTGRLHDLRLLLVPTIPLLIMRIYSLPLFATTMSRTSIRHGMKFFHLCQRYHLIMPWKVCKNSEYVSLISSRLY